MGRPRSSGGATTVDTSRLTASAADNDGVVRISWSGGNDGSVRIWDPASGESLLELRGHSQYVKAVLFSPDGTQLASESGDLTVRIWDTRTVFERAQQAGATRRP